MYTEFADVPPFSAGTMPQDFSPAVFVCQTIPPGPKGSTSLETNFSNIHAYSRYLAVQRELR